ncbi:hypothetical protein [Rhizobium leguminosarum]|uniref:hypothetical protein n=1 Tax=Rhizobium leguminosarum TaxID=384 RepID=UPI0021BBE041|nr:hypothetical protein [Rhizobium leguminosarum]
MSRDDNFLLLVLIGTLGIAGMIVWHIQGANRQTGRLIVEILFFTESRAFYGKHRAAPARWYRTPSKIAYEPKALGKR